MIGILWRAYDQTIIHSQKCRVNFQRSGSVRVQAAATQKEHNRSKKHRTSVALPHTPAQGVEAKSETKRSNKGFATLAPPSLEALEHLLVVSPHTSPPPGDSSPSASSHHPHHNTSASGHAHPAHGGPAAALLPGLSDSTSSAPQQQSPPAQSHPSSPAQLQLAAQPPPGSGNQSLCNAVALSWGDSTAETGCREPATSSSADVHCTAAGAAGDIIVLLPGFSFACKPDTRRGADVDPFGPSVLLQAASSTDDDPPRPQLASRADRPFVGWLSTATQALNRQEAGPAGDALQQAQELLQRGEATGDAGCTSEAAVMLARLACRPAACGEAQASLHAALHQAVRQSNGLDHAACTKLLRAAACGAPAVQAEAGGALLQRFMAQLPSSTLAGMLAVLSSAAAAEPPLPLPPAFPAAFFRASQPLLASASGAQLTSALRLSASLRLRPPLGWLRSCLAPLSARRPDVGPGRITAAMCALASLHRQRPLQAGLGTGWLDDLLEALGQHLPRLRPAGLARLTWVLGAFLHRPPPQVIRALLVVTWRSLPHLSAHSLACWLWGCSRLELRLPAAWTHDVLRCAATSLGGAPVYCQSFLLKSLAAMGIRPSAQWMAATLAATQPKLGAMSPCSAARLLWACEQAHHVPGAAWQAAFWVGMHGAAPECPAAALCTVLVAAARLGMQPGPDVLAAMLQQLQLQLADCSVRHLCRGLRAAAALGATADCGAVDAVLQHVDGRMWACGSRSAVAASLLDVLWALAAMRHQPPHSWLLPFVERTLQQSGDGAAPEQLAAALEALAALGFSPGRRWLQRIWWWLVPQQALLQRQQLVRAFLASTRLRHCPPWRVTYAVLDAVHNSRAVLGGDEMVQVALALAALQVRPSERWLHAFVNAFRAKVSTCSAGLAAPGVLATTALCARRKLTGICEPLVPASALGCLPPAVARAALRSAAVLPQGASSVWLQQVEAHLAGSGASTQLLRECAVLLQRLGHKPLLLRHVS